MCKYLLAQIFLDIFCGNKKAFEPQGVQRLSILKFYYFISVTSPLSLKAGTVAISDSISN